MSFVDSRAFVRNVMLGLGYKEHRDAFNWINIPQTNLDKIFHMTSNEVSLISSGNGSVVYNYSLDLRIFKTAFNDTVKDFEDFEVKVASVLDALLSVSKVPGSGLVSVTSGNFSIEPFDQTNDNILVAVISLDLKTVNCYY